MTQQMRITGSDEKYRKHTAARDRISEMLHGVEAGTRLLPDTQLSALLGVSRPTVRKAIDELVESGVLTRLPRRGVYTNRSPATQQFTICFLYRNEESLKHPFEALLRSQVETEVANRGQRLVSVSTEQAENMHSALAAADGLILRGRVSAALLPTNMPVVIPFLSDHFVPNATYVLVDDYLGGITAAQHLIALGHRQLAYVGHAHQEPVMEAWPHERYRGVCDAAAAAGLSKPLRINPEGGPISPDMFMSMTDHRATGAICDNDHTAMAVISCLHKIGRHVPEEISVIGFDDVPAAASFAPPLTTIKSPVQLIVATALDELERRISDPAGSVPRKITLPMELVERESCAPVRR
jgi:LacI family transcriptional regulator